MGLDAYVPCSCITRGLATACPVPLVHEDGGLWWVEREDDYADFARWRESACTHPRMQALSERVANWAGMRTLRDALEDVGQPVATLCGALPDSNAGLVDTRECAACLREVTVFRTLFKRITPHLVNASTGTLVYDFVAAYDGAFMWSRNGNVGFDGKGLFVTEPKTGTVVFRAKRVRAVPAEGGCELHDLDGNASILCGWSHEVETPYEVIEHVETAGDHEGKLAVLARLFAAAIDHDTCVVWC